MTVRKIFSCLMAVCVILTSTACSSGSDNSSALDSGSSVAEETSAAEESSTVEESSAAAEETSAVEETSAAEETYAPEETSAAEETSAPEESSDTTPSQGAQGEMRDMTANEYAKDMGIGENLGNTMEAYNAQNCEKSSYKWIPVVGSNTPQDYETCWGAVVTTQEVIDGMKAEGFDTVRIPVFWGNMMEDDGTYTINTQYLDRVEEIVKYCMNAGVYAVVNIHHFDEFIIRRNDLDSCMKIFDTLWTQIAERFKDYSDYVVFEGFNEYLGGQQFDESGELADVPQDKAYELTNALNQTFVDAVRATGGNNAQRLLIVSGYWTNIDLTTAPEFKLPTDSAKDKLMVSVHYIDNAMFWSNQIGGQKWLDYAKGQCEELKAAFTDKGIPVFVGETTAKYPASNMAKDATHTDSAECLELLLDMATDYGFVPVIWDTNDNMYSRTEYRIKDDSEREVIQKIAEKIKAE